MRQSRHDARAPALTCQQRAAAYVECAHARQPRCQLRRSCVADTQPCQVEHGLVFARKGEHAAVDLGACVVASQAVERGGTASQACQKRSSRCERQRGQQGAALVKHLQSCSSMLAYSTAQELATAHLRQVAAQQSRAVRSQRQLVRSHGWTWVASEPGAEFDSATSAASVAVPEQKPFELTPAGRCAFIRYACFCCHRPRQTPLGPAPECRHFRSIFAAADFSEKAASHRHFARRGSHSLEPYGVGMSSNVAMTTLSACHGVDPA